MRSSPVRYQLAVEGGGGGRFWFIFVFFFLRDGGRREDNGVSGCSCVSFDLAVTSCFHTITNSPPTHPPPPPKAPKKIESGREAASTTPAVCFNVPLM